MAFREQVEGGTLLADLTETNPTRVELENDGAPGVLAQVAATCGTYDPRPQGEFRAREAVARISSGSVDPDHIFLTASTSEAYAHVLRLLTSPGDNVIVPSPSYPLFEALATLEGVRLRSYRLRWEGRWAVDFDSLERAVDAGSRALFVVQPNNPTGSCLTADEISRFEEVAGRHGLALVSDEVFGSFPWNMDRERAPSLAGPRSVPTFILDGASKSCGIPQMKIAWITVFAPPSILPPILEGLAWISDTFLSASLPSQRALPEWLAQRGGYLAKVRGRLSQNRAEIAAFESRNPEVTLLPGEGGWSVVIRLPEIRNDEEWTLELLRRGVAIHPGHFYDIEEGCCLVASLIPRPPDFRCGLAALEGLLRESR